jgi:hypothetical protein
MKHLFLITIIIFTSLFAYSQEETVEVKGVGFGTDKKKAREDAIQDALRQAVAQVGGVHLKSSTEVQNFVTLNDAISTRADGYVKSSTVLEETPFPDKYEVKVRATVSLAPMVEDAKTLSEMVGGVNFIVVYDARSLTPAQKVYYDFAYERMNEKLNDKGYSRTEAALFAKAVTFTNNTNEIEYLSQVAMYTNSEFVIQIKDIILKTEEKAGGLWATQATMDVKAFDGCNWRNLGTVIFKGDTKVQKDKQFAEREAIADAVDLGFDRLMLQFNTDIGSWVDGGAPYELRFYSFTLDDLDFIEFVDLLIKDTNTVGEPQMTTVYQYFKLVLRSKNSQFGVFKLVLKSAVAIENFKTQSPSREILYGRQMSITPKGVKNAEIEAKKEILSKIKAQ